MYGKLLLRSDATSNVWKDY